VYKNGDVYQGDWFQGYKHGKGSYIYAEGTTVDVLIWWEGEWNMDKRSYGTYNGEGFHMIGAYKDGKPDG
ncbi:uncharacterized protein METZ01_LOCUS468730, partial [marine metagenome]